MSNPVDTRLVGSIILVTLGVITLYGIGIPVPTDSPYVAISIETDKQDYALGETMSIEYSVINRMPFKIRLDPFYPESIKTERMEYNDSKTLMYKTHPGEIITSLPPFGKHILQGQGLTNVSKPGDYLISLVVDDLELTKVIHVN